jgi:hypothetical protein
MHDGFVNVRCMVDDIEAAAAFYTPPSSASRCAPATPRLPTSPAATGACC